jgi:hypothetical protein
MLRAYNADENITVGITLLIEGSIVLRNYTKFEPETYL